MTYSLKKERIENLFYREVIVYDILVKKFQLMIYSIEKSSLTLNRKLVFVYFSSTKLLFRKYL